ncbi:hypothetical protein G7K_5200-t1 [Saitoella complicata NRRL Y-17804]|uniref:Protein transport protein SFT2 n=1 Tax=Saitoella complicata (strain BCRC 22490 / CBS 7301 / JCM 7358 / NBRC 10748 / NRRL Y-17804) TaxID=698492 RepID=A0A0E9NMQ9_SAICN|nr:hypothetical protein G7K_5200-t1 [Saitoella complicata NRRL Y-17804]
MTSNTESAFRSGLSSLGWDRQSDQLPPPTTASTNEGWGSRLRGMVPHGARDYLPIGAEEEDQGWFGIRLSRWDRLLIFGACILGAAVCFLVAFLMMPVLVLKPRKFVMLWTVGSLLFLSSFAALQGPISYFKHLFSGSRIPFTATYFTSMVLTIYFALGLQSTILTVVSAAVQVVCLVVYLVSYFPFGAGAIRLAEVMNKGRRREDGYQRYLMRWKCQRGPGRCMNCYPIAVQCKIGYAAKKFGSKVYENASNPERDHHPQITPHIKVSIRSTFPVLFEFDLPTRYGDFLESVLDQNVPYRFSTLPITLPSQDPFSFRRYSTAAAPAVEVPIIQTASSTASVESSTVAASTESSDDAATVNTENVEADAAAEKEEKPFVPAPAPKVNIWKVRAEELAKRAPAPALTVEEPVEEKVEKKEEKKDNEKKEKRGKKGSKSKKDDAKSEKKDDKKDEKKEEKTETAAPAEPKPKKSPLVVYDESLPAPTSVPGAALAAAADLAFDDQSSFPTIDIAKSADQKAPKKTKKPTAKADKKEKWVSLTPTIVHATPLPGKGQRMREGAQGQQQQRGQRRQGQNREGGEQQQGKRVQGQRRGSQSAKKPQAQQAQDKSAETAAVEKKEEASDAAAAPAENKKEEEVVANGVNAQQQQPAQQQQQQQRGPRPPRQFNNNNRVSGGPMYTGAPQHQHHGQRRGGRMGGQYRGGWDMQAQMQQMQQWDMRPYILGQIDYYFSLDNLCKDLFLRRHMDGEGWVAVAFLANFNRVKQLTLDEKVVREACRGSQIVEVSQDGEKARKREGWEMWVVPEAERLVFERPAPVAAGAAAGAEEKKVEEEDVKVNGVHEEEKTEVVAEVQA